VLLSYAVLLIEMIFEMTLSHTKTFWIQGSQILVAKKTASAIGALQSQLICSETDGKRGHHVIIRIMS